MTPHRLAIGAAGLTYILLLAGGLVHSTGASLACPDWPLCFGQFFPPMIGNIRFEHSHRLIAATVGFLTLFMAIAVWRRERPSLRPLAVAAVAAVVIQIVLGGITVIYLLPDIVSTAHLAVGSAFFALLIVLCLKTSKSASAQVVEVDGRTRGLIWIAGVSVYAQMILGALVRHTESGLACLDMPACGGEWILPLATPKGLHMLHRYGAMAVMALTAGVFWMCRGHTQLRWLGLAAFSLVTAQVAVGILAVTSRLSLPSVMFHLGLAEALLATFVILAMRTTARPRPSERMAYSQA